MVFVLVDPAAPSVVAINLSSPNPVFTKAFTNVPAKFPLAELMFAEIPGAVWKG